MNETWRFRAALFLMLVLAAYPVTVGVRAVGDALFGVSAEPEKDLGLLHRVEIIRIGERDGVSVYKFAHKTTIGFYGVDKNGNGFAIGVR